MDGGSVSPDLLTSLLGDSQLMERVSQLVAQSRAASVESPPDSDAAPASAIPPTDGLEVEDTTNAPGSAATQSTAADGSGRLSGLASLLGDNELMSRLPSVLSMLSPDKPTDGGDKPNGGGKTPGCDRRVALLSALKPYMSPRRCEAIDYLIRINRMGDILRRVR